MQQLATRYIPAGFQERSFITADGKGFGVVYWGESSQPYFNGCVTVQRVRYHAIAYQGHRANKPVWNYVFVTKDQMDREIENFFLGIKRSNDYKQERETKRREFIPTLKPGDILDTCWGYDQTNREFFQVIRVTGKTAVLREIAPKQIAATGPYSATVIGIKDHFLENEKEISRRILSPNNSVKIDDCRYASLWDGKPVHCSWGA